MARWLIVALCVPCLLLIGCKGKGAKSDQDRIQGTWEILTTEGKGQVILNFTNEKDKPRWVFAGDKMNVISEAGNNPNTFTLNTKTSPKQIDLFGPDNDNRIGIYELNGDELTVCQVGLAIDPSATRPTEFNSKERGALIKLRRVRS